MRTRKSNCLSVIVIDKLDWGFQRGGHGPLVQRKALGVSKGGEACAFPFDHEIATLSPSGLDHRSVLGGQHGW